MVIREILKLDFEKGLKGEVISFVEKIPLTAYKILYKQYQISKTWKI